VFLAIAVDNLANAQELTAAEEQAAEQREKVSHNNVIISISRRMVGNWLKYLTLKYAELFGSDSNSIVTECFTYLDSIPILSSFCCPETPSDLFTIIDNPFQEKKEEEMAAKQPCTIPGYFDPATVNLYFPTTANGQDQKTLNFNA